VGLDTTALFPERITHNALPAEQIKWRREAMHRDWVMQADILLTESRVLWLAASEIVAGRSLNKSDFLRVKQSMQSIEAAGKVLNDR
jgi:hypothetical protein